MRLIIEEVHSCETCLFAEYVYEDGSNKMVGCRLYCPAAVSSQQSAVNQKINYRNWNSWYLDELEKLNEEDADAVVGIFPGCPLPEITLEPKESDNGKTKNG